MPVWSGLRSDHDNDRDMVTPATRHEEDPGVSILFRAEIAACRSDGVTVPQSRHPSDKRARLQCLAARLIADNPHVGDELVASPRVPAATRRTTGQCVPGPND